MSELVKDWVADVVALVLAFCIGTIALAEGKILSCTGTQHQTAAHSESSR